MKSRDHVSLSPDPSDVIGRAARQCAQKERLPESLYLDHQRRTPRQRHAPEPATQFPRRLFVEHRKSQPLFLSGNDRKIFA